jgi:class 3 adenylate cyclase
MLFVLQMNRMVGANVLRYFVAGRYHQPTAEERIFLFLDLEQSTTLAERLGSARYFELLRRFVDDLTDPIVASRGEIYQYAGDEVGDVAPRRGRARRQLCPLLLLEPGRGSPGRLALHPRLRCRATLPRRAPRGNGHRR